MGVKPVSRTDLYEAMLARVADLRRRATAASTAARAYADLAEMIASARSSSSIADEVAADVIRYIRARERAARSLVEANSANADQIEREGVR